MITNQTPITTPKTQEFKKTEMKTKPPRVEKNPRSKRKSRYILGAVLLVILIVGLTATYWLTKQSQDIRQQASEGDVVYYKCNDGMTCWHCDTDPTGVCSDDDGKTDYCEESGCSWVGNICSCGGSATCDGPGVGGGDPCAANGGYCAGTDIIRCNCGNGNWVGGKKEAGCSALCGEAGLDCEPSCGGNEDPPGDDDPTPTPTSDPSPSPSSTPSPTPSPSPSPSPTPSPTPSVSPSPSPSPTPSPTPSPSPSPSPTPSPTPSVSPSPSPSVSPTPSPSPTYLCDYYCDSDSQCQTANADYVCSAEYGNKCRLNDNPESAECQPKSQEYACNSGCESNEQCQSASSSYICYQNNCRLDSNPSADNCQPDSYVAVVVGCNDTCESNGDCSNSEQICYNNACRLATNPTSSTCSAPQTAYQSTKGEQPVLPAELPESGSNILLDWLKAGIGVLGIGAVLLLLL